MFTVVFQQIGLVIKLFISEATDFWSFWIICWKTNVNLNHFYLLNLWKILLGGLGYSSRTERHKNNSHQMSPRNQVHN